MATILFATDFSKASQKAFKTAVGLAKSSRATLTLVHVVVPFTPIVPEQYLSAGTWEQIDAQARLFGQRQLRRLTEKARTAGVRAVALLMEGDPAYQVTRAARRARASFLVVGTHGRTGLARFFVGSVAARIVATASCPVVTVRDRR